jgi:hypothetical protein
LHTKEYSSPLTSQSSESKSEAEGINLTGLEADGTKDSRPEADGVEDSRPEMDIDDEDIDDDEDEWAGISPFEVGTASVFYEVLEKRKHTYSKFSM